MQPEDEGRSCCFDDWARSNAKRARAKETVAPVTGALLDALAGVGLGGRTVLDVGCGAGDLALATLAHGAAHASGVDMGAGAIEEARDLAEARGLAERAAFAVGDGATAELPHADVVVLNRVVCCYADPDALLDNSLTSAREVFAFTAPVDRGPVGVFNRVLVRFGNGWYRIRKRKFGGFRVFVHDLDRLDERVHGAGFETVRRERRRIVWQMEIFVRS